MLVVGVVCAKPLVAIELEKGFAGFAGVWLKADDEENIG